MYICVCIYYGLFLIHLRSIGISHHSWLKKEVSNKSLKQGTKKRAVEIWEKGGGKKQLIG